jgi:hypothetical protein
MEIQALETLDYKSEYETEHPHGSCSLQYTHSTGKIAAAAFALSTIEDLLLPFDQPFNTDESSNFDPMRQTTKVEDLSLQFSDLFNFGLRKLILSGTTRNQHVKVIGRSKLQNLSLLAPAVFNLEYREVSVLIYQKDSRRLSVCSGDETESCFDLYDQEVTHADARKQQQSCPPEQAVCDNAEVNWWRRVRNIWDAT